MADEPDNLMLRLLREIREGQESMQVDINEIKSDLKELNLRVSLLEVRNGRVAERIERIEKHLSLVEA
jgi:hypothetical protein